MALSDPRIIYGIHSFAAINRTNGEPYGVAKVLANSSFNVTGELTELFGGSQKYAWAIEEGNNTAELALNVKQIEDWMFTLFLGKAPTVDTAGSATGAVSTIANKNGTSMVASTGMASVGAKTSSESDMKFTKYVVKATGAAAFDVYAMTDLDFNRGTDKSFENDLLKITASPLTLVQSAAVEIPGFGIEITGDSGTIALVTGDTAVFEVYPPYDKTSEVKIGGTSDTFVEFSAYMVAQKRSNGEMFEITAFRVKGSGLPLGLAEKAFGEPEITAKAFYDSTEDAVAEIRMVKPTTA